MEGENRGKNRKTVYVGEDEQRNVRPLMELYVKNKQYMFPDDDKSIQNIQDDYLEKVHYIFYRCTKKGYAEKEMIEELHNIALVFRGYCSKDEQEIWKEKWNDYFIRFFDHILKCGLDHNRSVIATLLVESGLLEFLSLCISEIQTYEYEFGLISGYLEDASVSDVNKHMLCFMTSKVCPSVKEKVSINLEELSAEELIAAIRTQYYEGEDKLWVNRRLVSLLSEMDRADGKSDKYDLIVRDLINLHIGNMLPITMYRGLVEYHPLYKLLYHPDDIDYNSIDLNNFINIKSQRIIDNAIEHGGYILYKRIREKYRRDKRVKLFEAFRQILVLDRFKQLYDMDSSIKKKKA